jgi:hypothetical protein
MKRLRKLKPGIVPRPLKIWFLIHFAVDMLFAIPLMIAPRMFLSAFAWKVVDPITTRLVAAALFGIGIESLLSVRAPLPTFVGMLNLKIIWSSAAIIGIAVSLAFTDTAAPRLVWAVLGIFLVFDIVWIYWRVRTHE